VTSANPWLMLGVAVVVELVGTMALKASHGFTELPPSLLFLFAFAISFYLGSQIVNRLPLGTVYAIWAGAGTALTAVSSALVFGEMLSLAQVCGIASIVAGVVVLNLATAGPHQPQE
jgi:small multidrug resistance pump